MNSFLRHCTYSRPLLARLQASTYKTYKLVWKRLLCFVYRMIHRGEQPALQCTLTSLQSAALEEMLQAVQAVVRAEARAKARAKAGPSSRGGSASVNSDNDDDNDNDDDEYRVGGWGGREPEADMGSLYESLDQACLQFCITLLDHRLLGRIYDSVVLSFLAVLGIDKQGSCFLDATRYTSHLSAFVKIAQLLVVQCAVLAADCGETEFPAEALEEMQDRFMVYESRSPMSWVLKLQLYGKKICKSTTSLGFIIWSDDAEQLSYLDVELSMAQLRQFVRKQLDLVQTQLHEVLLIHPDEHCKSVVPLLSLAELKDNPMASEPSWSFLQDPRNTLSLKGGERWVLDRVLDQDWLQDEFRKAGRWRQPAVSRYMSQVEAFLACILLLAYIISGQPARGTELLSIQHCNTAYGLWCSIFVENGLVSFVTFYHKGYSVSGSVKIIHRYLPPEVSELVVYYLWLVLLFCQQLRLLTSDTVAPPLQPSTFLWSQSHKPEPWPSTQLTGVLQREFSTHCGMKINMCIWRHAAIAISRKHLRQAKFRKDYGMQPTPA